MREGEDNPKILTGRVVLGAIAGFVWELAMVIAHAKGWLARVPDLIVVALFVVPILAGAYLFLTHDAVKKHCHLIRDHRKTSLLVLIVFLAAMVASVWYLTCRARTPAKWNKGDLAINQMSGCTIEIPAYDIHYDSPVEGQSQNEPEPPSEGPNIFSEEFQKMFIAVGNNIIELPNSNGAKVPLFVIDNVGSLALGGIAIVLGASGSASTTPRSSTIPAISFIRNGKVFVDAEIYGGPGRPSMHVRKNHISDRPADWDENSDKTHAIEIVNAEQVPVLQIIYPDKAHAIIKGVFSAGSGLVVIADDDGLMTFHEQDGSKFPIKRLFKYPSWKYSGIFEESMPPSPTPNTEASPH